MKPTHTTRGTKWYFLSGCLLLSRLVGVVIPPIRHHDAVAMVMSTRDETRLRLLLGRPDTIFRRLSSSSTGSTNRDLATGHLTSHKWSAIDADYRQGLYYVVDQEARCITAIPPNATRDHIYCGTSNKVTAISVDWLNDAVYWTDAAFDSIFRFKDTGRCRGDGCMRTVVGTRLDTPTGIAVFPRRQYLFWTDLVDGLGKLERSDLGGQNRILLVDGLSSPRALTLDYRTNRVYWLAQSGDVSVVEACDLNGENRYSAAVFAGRRMRDLSVFHNLLLLVDAARHQLVLHDISTNHSQRLLVPGTPHGACVTAAGVQPMRPQALSRLVDADKDPLDEGFLVLVSEDSGISILDKTLVTSRTAPSARTVVSRASITAVAADVHNNTLYFFDRVLGAIQRISLDFLRPGSRSADRRPPEVVTRVPGLAVDWLAGIIYWTDRRYRRLVAATTDGRHVRSLVYDYVSEPRDVVVHPVRRLLFWTDVDAQDPRIERMQVTGARREIIVSGSMLYERPLALTIDFKRDMLYWSDGPRMCRSDLWGRRDEPCLPPTDPRPAIRSLDIVHDFVVWTNFNSGVKTCDKEEDFQSLYTSNHVTLSDTYFRDVLYFHASRQPQAPSFVDDKFLLVTDPKLGGIFQQFLLLPDYYVIPVKHVIRPSDVTFDSTSHMLYWSDTGTGSISRAYLNGSRQELVFAHRDIVADRLFLDELGQLLVFIDTTGHKVGVLSLESGLYRVIVDTPRTKYFDVTMDLWTSKIYLSAVRADESVADEPVDFTNTGTGVIISCDVGGDSVSDVMRLSREKPRGVIVMDGVLYWVDAGLKTINAVSLRTGSTTVLANLTGRSTPDDVTKTGDHLYWTDSNKPAVYRLDLAGGGEVEERGEPVLFQTRCIDSYDSHTQPGESVARGESRNPCPADNTGSVGCHSVTTAMQNIMTEKGFCVVPSVDNGRVTTLRSGAFVTSGYVIDVHCKPGYGLNNTIWNFNSTCDSGTWFPEPSCVWAMSYSIRRTTGGGHFVIFASTTDFIVPEGVTYVDALAIGGGGGGVRACSTGVPNVTRAGDGGESRLGRYLRAGGGTGGTVNSGGRGGFGTVYFGGPGKRSSSCLGGGAAGETMRSENCYLGSTRCPFCGAGAAPPGCSLCHERRGGCSGGWALASGVLNADQFGGGATGWSGGGGGGGGGYSRRYVDVMPGEVIRVEVGRGGWSAVGRAGEGVVVVAWGGRLEDVLPAPGNVTCRNFRWTADADEFLRDDVRVDTCQGRIREP
ncbi:hypothetical protein BaRGS_00016280 [Batillaria attramentaria]|uniref:Sushi domain-containing protein n=1 Tax=Batillaria attramentaria TaxID=370345 RepID=A0ABD0KYW1_9CAEN